MTGTATEGAAAAISHISAQRLTELTCAVVDTASPTGEEAALAEKIATILTPAVDAVQVRHLSSSAANIYGTVYGSTARTLLLYAPLDTVTSGDMAEDIPWSTDAERPDMLAEAVVDGDWIIGLGAQNPKGHLASILMAIEAIAASAEKPAGTVVAGFGSLGMPSNRRRPELLDGHGAGCAALVEEISPDAAVIAKSGWAISHTEVGLVWFDVTVSGTHTYVGSRHLIEYRNPIVDAAKLVGTLESWFELWAERHDDGPNRPQGIIGSIDGGKQQHRAFTPASCTFTVDLRLPPDVSADHAESEFRAMIEAEAAEHDIAVVIDRVVAIPGTLTDASEPVVTAAVASWEELTGETHVAPIGLSGATDANILRMAGIPTARVGLPKVSGPGIDVDFAFGMNAVSITDQVRLTELLVKTVYAYFEEAA